MVTPVQIAGKKIGPAQPCFIIAEAGVNHNGKLDLAYQLVDIAAQVGADAVKFQTFKAEKVISPQATKANYQIETTGDEETQLEMVKKLELSYENFRDLYEYCEYKGIMFLSTPFGKESADFLDDLGMAAFKIPSGEITNLPFLEHLARKGRPMIISTGMTSLGEVETAVQSIQNHGSSPFALLHCVSNYPTAPADANLRAMHTLQTAFDVPIGFSDHTLGIEIPLAAVALGAQVIEKHFTLNNDLPGPDHRASLEPEQLKDMVTGIRKVESALGDGQKRPAASEANTASVARRSLVAARDIPAGTVLSVGMIAIMRPGDGLLPAMHDCLIGRKLNIAIRAGTLFKLDMLI